MALLYEHRALGGFSALAIYGLGGLVLNSMRISVLLRIFWLNLVLNLAILLCAAAYLTNVYGPRVGLFVGDGRLDPDGDRAGGAAVKIDGPRDQEAAAGGATSGRNRRTPDESR